MWKLGASIQILIGVSTGVVLGFTLKMFTAQPWTERNLMYLLFPGELFLRIVNCLILPLVLSSIISASSNLEQSGGKIGSKTLLYYIVTSTVGILLSITLTLSIRPGEWGSEIDYLGNFDYTDDDEEQENSFVRVNFTTADAFLDLARNLLPENLIQACLYQDGHNKSHRIEDYLNFKFLCGIAVYDLPISHEYTSGTNVLGLVFFSLVFGLALSKMPAEQKLPLQNFFQSLAAATGEIVDAVIKSAPIAVVFLISSKLLRTEETQTELTRLLVFVATVLLGLAIQALLLLPLIYFIWMARWPYKIIKNLGPALVTAFGTSSSTATVPTTIRCLDKLGVDPKVSRFVAPIGASINLDGIALYETVGAIFIMQMRGFHLSLIQTAAVSITCTLSCIGAAGIPSGGYPMLIMVLNAYGIPAEDVALIIAVDSFIDRFRTMVNIIADSLGSAIISRLIRKEKIDAEHAFQDFDEIIS
uniref:Amino acid transporter n=1 Tax=Trichogramma kaykai TaxID=54128 RepID=A0ABD2X6X3_9HYME